MRRRRSRIPPAWVEPVSAEHAVLIARANGAPHGKRRDRSADLVAFMTRQLKRDARLRARQARGTAP